MRLNRHLSRFLGSDSAFVLAALFCGKRNAAKEITESWACLAAAKRFVDGLNEHLVVVVGDGARPRTAALFAYFTRAEAWSVDPLLDMEFWAAHVRRCVALGEPPQRIRLFRQKIEAVEIDAGGRPCLLVWPHSHAPMDVAHVRNAARVSDIALPCCQPPPARFRMAPHLVYEDNEVASPKREIHIWLQHTLRNSHEEDKDQTQKKEPEQSAL